MLFHEVNRNEKIIVKYIVHFQKQKNERQEINKYVLHYTIYIVFNLFLLIMKHLIYTSAVFKISRNVKNTSHNLLIHPI